MKSRPVGLIIISLLLIFSGLRGSYSFISSLQNKESYTKENAAALLKGLDQRSRADQRQMISDEDKIRLVKQMSESDEFLQLSIFEGVSSIASLIIGVGLLLLADVARLAFLLFGLLRLPIKTWLQYKFFILTTTLFAGYVQHGQEALTMVNKFIPFIIGIIFVMDAAIFGAIAYYLTRPSVKACFKK